MKTITCCFAGHSQISDAEQIKLKLKKEIINLIENHGVTEFYSGGKGNFDVMCAVCASQIKMEYPHIKSYLVLSYIPQKVDDYTIYFMKHFDDTIYPNLEKVPPRYAILKRNEWMIDNSDFLIAYIEHSWGGAVKTLEYAEKKKHIKIINLSEVR